MVDAGGRLAVDQLGLFVAGRGFQPPMGFTFRRRRHSVIDANGTLLAGITHRMPYSALWARSPLSDPAKGPPAFARDRAMLFSRRPKSDLCHAAVDRQLRSCDVTALVACEE